MQNFHRCFTATQQTQYHEKGPVFTPNMQRGLPSVSENTSIYTQCISSANTCKEPPELPPPIISNWE